MISHCCSFTLHFIYSQRIGSLRSVGGVWLELNRLANLPPPSFSSSKVCKKSFKRKPELARCHQYFGNRKLLLHSKTWKLLRWALVSPLFLSGIVTVLVGGVGCLMWYQMEISRYIVTQKSGRTPFCLDRERSVQLNTSNVNLWSCALHKWPWHRVSWHLLKSAVLDREGSTENWV